MGKSIYRKYGANTDRRDGYPINTRNGLSVGWIGKTNNFYFSAFGERDTPPHSELVQNL